MDIRWLVALPTEIILKRLLSFGHIKPTGLVVPLPLCANTEHPSGFCTRAKHQGLALDITPRFPLCWKWKANVKPAFDISALLQNSIFLSGSHWMVLRMVG